MSDVITTNDDNSSVIEDESEEIIVVEGDTGPQGPPGVAIGGSTGDVLTKQSDDDYDVDWTPLNLLGDKNFVQNFSSATSVTVTHNLGKYPAVTVVDSANDEVEGEVEHISVNELVVTFSAPFSGKVVCN
jgi:hypothetical protein